MKPRASSSDNEQCAADWALAETLLALPDVRTILAHGPPGTGKTYAAMYFGRVAAGIFPVTLTPEMPASELLGHYSPRGNDLIWQDGPFALAMRSGGRLIINEVSHASSDVLAILYPVLESAKTAQLMLSTGEVLRPMPGFHVVATDNEPPDGLPEALQDRFECVVNLEWPHPAAMAALHPRVRRAAERSFLLDDERRISMRRWMMISHLQAKLGFEKACHAVLGRLRGTQVFEAINLSDEG
jgi:MoxR-like ATPase